MNDKIAIIQARTGSSRLPNKILLKILDKEILLLLIDRVIASKLINKIIIATTTNTTDNKIVDLVKNYHPKVLVYRGDENDVLDRYYQAANEYKSKYTNNLDIIRITSDCPLIDPNVIDLHIIEFDKRNVDYLSSRINKRTWPHGMEMEILTFKSLQQAWRNATESFEREHVTPYIYKSNPEKFKLYEFGYEKDISNYRFTIDYEEDYEFVKEIFEKLYKNNALFTLDEIIQLLESEPALLKINACRINPEI
ncbi:MAG: glycosyltransferase family protein [Calditrichia bacterium]|nr:glycosyltransferase family protein [Calditrichia bacterium]